MMISISLFFCSFYITSLLFGTVRFVTISETSGTPRVGEGLVARVFQQYASGSAGGGEEIEADSWCFKVGHCGPPKWMAFRLEHEFLHGWGVEPPQYWEMCWETATIISANQRWIIGNFFPVCRWCSQGEHPGTLHFFRDFPLPWERYRRINRTSPFKDRMEMGRSSVTDRQWLVVRGWYYQTWLGDYQNPWGGNPILKQPGLNDFSGLEDCSCG